MQTTPDNTAPPPSRTASTDGAFPRDALLVLVAAILGRLPALGAFWNRDDWTLLARASGLIESDAFPARIVSQDLYWRVLYPVFGLATDPWTWTRLLLHAATAWLVRRIALRIGLSKPAALLAGLLFAAAPLAFTPLYWASGVQELLGAALALLAVERLLATGRSAIPIAVAAGVLAIFAKENALLIGVFAVVLAIGGDQIKRRARLTAAGIWIVAAIVEILLLWQHFPHGAGTGYVLDPLTALPKNLVFFGWWLVSPAPALASEPNLIVALGGLLVWSLWLTWSWKRWRAGDKRPAVGLTAALLSVAPALAVDMTPRPYLAYLAFAPAVLVLASAVWDRHRRITSPLAIGLMVACTAMGWVLTEARLAARDDDALSSDPLVLHTAVSHAALQTLDAMPPDRSAKIFILQLEDMSIAPRRGILAPTQTPLPSILHTALAGDLGYRLYGDAARSVTFVRRLDATNRDALVFADSGPRLRFWGPVPQAHIYQTLTQIAYGHHDAAVKNLWRGLRNSKSVMPFVFDESQLPVTPDAVRARKEAFLHRIQTLAGLEPEEREAMITTAQELFALCNITP